MRRWGVDGYKLDFLDMFRVFGENRYDCDSVGVDPAVKDGFRGRDTRSVPQAAEKLLQLFGISRALLMGGGLADGTFAAADCVDELSLVVAPVAEVASGQPSLFETVRGLSARPLSFELVEARRLPASGLWLHYMR